MAKGKSALAMALKKKIGSNDEIQKVSHWIDSGFPPLNKAISGRYDGGFPSGRIVEIFGPPSAGKTFLATAAMVSAQKQEGLAVFLDHENSFDVGLAVANGLNADEDDGQWVYKQPDTFEESVELIGTILKLVRDEELIPADAPICIVADSLASMVPNSKAEKFDKMAEGTAKDKDQLNMNDNTALARATSANFPTLALWARKYNACIIFLNQVRTKIGVMFGDPTTSPGGDSPKFYASVRIRLGASVMKDGKDKIGQDVGAECI
ncbi:recombinase RecA, partial [Klebsiella pneumoniae]